MSTNNRFKEGLKIPATPEAINGRNFVEEWYKFFQRLFDINKSASVEMYFAFKNNLANQVITGLQFDYAKVSQVTINYFIQRVSFSAGATPGIGKVESGILSIYYNPKTKTWGSTKTVTSGANTAGATFSVNSSGQVLLSSTNENGSWSSGAISKMSYNYKIIEAKYVDQPLGWL